MSPRPTSRSRHGAPGGPRCSDARAGPLMGTPLVIANGRLIDGTGSAPHHGWSGVVDDAADLGCTKIHDASGRPPGTNSRPRPLSARYSGRHVTAGAGDRPFVNQWFRTAPCFRNEHGRKTSRPTDKRNPDRRRHRTEALAELAKCVPDQALGPKPAREPERDARRPAHSQPRSLSSAHAHSRACRPRASHGQRGGQDPRRPACIRSPAPAP